MFQVLANRIYRHLFLAQVIALVGTGLLTVALGLLAYQLAPERAGVVLGTALAIKMIAYVGVAPIVGAFADRLPRRAFLISMDVVRAGIALLLPFVTEIWQIYVLIFLLQSASAAFTPTFQATIPDVLPDEKEYTRALSLSRLAYDLETLLSPMLAAALLTLISFHWLFLGTVVGFVGSAALVLSVRVPQAAPIGRADGIYGKLTRGLRIYLATPRLRGLLALNLTVAAAGAMVIVNTVVIVRSLLGRPEADVALALGCFGGGSMIAALVLPRLLDRLPDRIVMLAAAAWLAMLLMACAAIFGLVNVNLFAPVLWPVLLGFWVLLGLGYSTIMVPTGRLLQRSAHAADRPAVFAAQFALSHACWLLTYPLAGWFMSTAGPAATFALLGGLAVLGLALAVKLWPIEETAPAFHEHPDLPPDHPHFGEHPVQGPGHAHPIVVDHLHSARPGRSS
jgi:H+ antiporter protein